MSNKVNLDALIRREDFEAEDTTASSVGRHKDTLSINDLKKDEFFFANLHKPDFQRETNEWDSRKVCDLIESFLDEDLIPAIILWRSASGLIFVIDGSHRLSALAAWINNDYGDGDLSKQFYDSRIPEDQLEIADRTRRLVNKRVGEFTDYQLAMQFPGKVRPEIADRAKRLGALGLQLQWVTGSSKKAEDSFFKINQQASPIDQTELRVLKARRQPHGVAARAIMRSGLGHKYWSSFSNENQVKIQELAEEIHQILFSPRLTHPIKTLDLPIAGQLHAAQTLALVLDFITIINNVPKDGVSLDDDIDGRQTVNFLVNCKNIARRINSIHPGSLGLHPIVYFYSQDGRHKIASFFAVTALVQELENTNQLNKFIRVRSPFEALLLEHDELVQQIVRKHRSASNSYAAIKRFYLLCIEKLADGRSREEVILEILREADFQYLKLAASGDHDGNGVDFSSEIKSRIYIKEAIQGAVRCKICNGYLHRNSISFDHIVRKEDGGLGDEDNAQMTHPFCNSTIKH